MPKKNARKKPVKRKTAKKQAKPSPKTNGDNGRDSSGKFTKGNKGGPGNPYAKKTAELRNVFFECVTKKDMEEVVQALLKKAKKGDVHAIKELLLRVLGQPQEFKDHDEEKNEEWVGRLSISDGRYVVVNADGDPIEAHASLGSKESEEPERDA